MRTDFKEERKWKIATTYMISRAVMEWHWADDKRSVCVKTKPHIPIDERKQPEPMEIDEVKMEEPTDSTMLEGVKTEQKTEQLDTQTSSQENQPSALSASSTMPPPPSPNIWNEFKTAILAMDPDNPIYALPIDGTTDFDISSLFPELPLYEPPQPNDADAYIDELEYGRVVPITKFISQKMSIKKKAPPSKKRTAEEAFSDTGSSQEDVPQLPKHEKYDNTQYLSRMYNSLVVTNDRTMLANIFGEILALFALRKAKDTPATQPPTPQPPNPAINRHPPTWSDEDDVCLITLIVQYSFNWSLICDAFNSIRRPVTGEQRTAYECHERWRQNNLTSLSGQVNAGECFCCSECFIVDFS
jgi:chromatin modification-related protein VID21